MSSKALNRLKRKLTVETLWIYVAKTLLNKEPLRGYDIVKALRNDMGIKASTITVYSVIYRMVREGLLETIKSDGESLYRLSQKGREEFEKALEFLENILNILKSP
ncbi:PadR family transcriptional regulator [Ignisphaera sp. 4213-co]|uniref:PadR family transcriptional regulator n=1 Tax=Ignisphaera cupida TaxID=3050454 RepID=A0ABD4Z986_9CREN|nr:PadR family transcriptional regulator [Ignisphaera sp. 4213-co]MDK6029269.1 PadR family transcriptional regulator [Ignisphaera sp. 4213-co]